MLAVETQFPEAGSYALLPQAAGPVIARIISVDADKVAQIAVEGGPGASGLTRIPLDRLLDPTPLTPEEETELNRLHRACGDGSRWAEGRTKAAVAERSRYATLSLRRLNAQTFATLRGRRTWDEQDEGRAVA